MLAWRSPVDSTAGSSPARSGAVATSRGLWHGPPRAPSANHLDRRREPQMVPMAPVLGGTTVHEGQSANPRCYGASMPARPRTQRPTLDLGAELEAGRAAQRVRPRVSAHHRPRHRLHRRRGGAAAVAPSAARHDRTGRLPASRRGERAHRPHRRAGPRRGDPPAADLASRLRAHAVADGQRERLAPAAHRSALRRACRDRPSALRPRSPPP